MFYRQIKLRKFVNVIFEIEHLLQQLKLWRESNQNLGQDLLVEKTLLVDQRQHAWM